MPELKLVRAAFTTSQLVMIHVSLFGIDTKTKCDNWASTNGVTWPIAIDVASNVENKYQVSGVPDLFVIDYQGVVKYEHLGYGGGSLSTTLISEITACLQPVINQPPVAAFTWSPSPGIKGAPVAFDASASSDPEGSALSYAWTFGDGGTGTGKTPSHTYAAAGDYSVKLTVTDNKQATGSITKTVHVEDSCFVIPQFPFGSIAGSIACLAALSGFFVYKRKRL